MARDYYRDPVSGNLIAKAVKVEDTLPIGFEGEIADGTPIPEGWVEVDDPNEYSTEEQVIGKFLGKPLYRKTFDISNISNTNENLVYLQSYNIEYITKMYGFVKASDGYQLPIPLYDSASNYSVILYNSAYLRGRCSIGSGGTVSKAFITVEYTKTTD